jgi:DivIVA domain-containing protein
MRKKKQEQDAPPTGDGRLTPVDVQQVEFRLAFRGYSERDVDAFLDRITEDLSAYQEEIERLRTGTGLPPAAPPPAMPDGRAEVDEVLARAHEEAASIVRRAEAMRGHRAAAGRRVGRYARGRRAVPDGEREFLQALNAGPGSRGRSSRWWFASLRASGESPASAAGAAEPAELASEATPPAPTTTDGARDERPPVFPGQVGQTDPSAASASEIADRLGMSTITVPSAPEDEDDEEPLIIEPSSTEPAFSSEGAAAGERRERSLRELFWGEE